MLCVERNKMYFMLYVEMAYAALVSPLLWLEDFVLCGCSALYVRVLR